MNFPNEHVRASPLESDIYAQSSILMIIDCPHYDTLLGRPFPFLGEILAFPRSGQSLLIKSHSRRRRRIAMKDHSCFTEPALANLLSRISVYSKLKTVIVEIEMVGSQR